ncbi:hypothetical protein HK104_005260 [Borealophlyctis nickersoniae]|nr:hypothetical protein HK104_005260 [Borealophlyctis nickersoniae]
MSRSAHSTGRLFLAKARERPCRAVRLFNSASLPSNPNPKVDPEIVASVRPPRPPLRPKANPPNVYYQLQEIMRKHEESTGKSKDKAAAEKLVKDDFDATSKAGTTTVEKRPSQMSMREGLRDRLIADGGDKLILFRRNYLHVEYTRFITLCDQVKGLTLDQAFLQIKWFRKPITKRMEDALKEAMTQAKEQGFDLTKTYVADAFVKENAAILSERLVKKFIKGRGRYGATAQPKTALLEIMLQERDRPFEKREADPLEWLRVRLRERQRQWVPTPDEIYKDFRERRPIKPVFC